MSSIVATETFQIFVALFIKFLIGGYTVMVRDLTFVRFLCVIWHYLYSIGQQTRKVIPIIPILVMGLIMIFMNRQI